MASNKPVYLTTKRPEIGMSQRTQKAWHLQALVRSKKGRVTAGSLLPRVGIDPAQSLNGEVFEISLFLRECASRFLELDRTNRLSKYIGVVGQQTHCAATCQQLHRYVFRQL
jgi:hypothetical protein